MTSIQINPSAQQLLARARDITRLDIIDGEMEEPLERLLRSLNTEAELNERGAAEMEERLLRLLSNRLRMQRDLAAHPEIREQKIVRPLILTGGGRTGSTKLHKMLAASGDFLYLPYWRGYSLSTRSGDRNEDPAPRIRDAEEHARWFDIHAPVAKLIHGYDAHEPEEETLLLEHALCGMYMMAYVYIPSYVMWSVQHMRAHMEYMKTCLQYVQWQYHDGDSRRWLLKCPIHFGNEPLLKQVFPDASLVATHRTPLHTVSSSSSLLQNYYAAYSDASRKPALGVMILEGTGAATMNSMAARDNHPDLGLLELRYPAVDKNAELVAEKMYAHAGMTLSDSARQAMRQWENENAVHKLGVHKHSLEEFSLTSDMVTQKFGPYIERFKGYF